MIPVPVSSPDSSADGERALRLAKEFSYSKLEHLQLLEEREEKTYKKFFFWLTNFSLGLCLLIMYILHRAIENRWFSSISILWVVLPSLIISIAPLFCFAQWQFGDSYILQVRRTYELAKKIRVEFEKKP